MTTFTQGAIAKSREKIKAKVPFLSPVEKLAKEFNLKKKIDKKLGKKEVTSESFTEKAELKEEVKKPEKKSFKEGFVKRVIKTSLGILGFGIGKEVLSKGATESVAGTASELLTDDKKLKIANNKLEKELNNENSILYEINNEKDPAKKDEKEEKKERYRKKSFGLGDMLKESWNESSKDEDGKKRGFFSHLWSSFSRAWTNGLYFFKIKWLKRRGILKLQDELKELEKKKNEAAKSAKKGLKNAKQLKNAEKSSGVKFLRKNKIPAKDLAKGFEKETAILRKAFGDGKISAKTLAKGLEEANVKLFKEAAFNKQVKPLLKIMKKGGIEGLELPAKFSLKTSKLSRSLSKLKVNPLSMGVAGAITISAIKGKEQGSFGAFFKSLVSKETLTEAFIPGVGTTRSIKRNWNNPEVPTWLKAADIGLNVAGDIMLGAGYVSSFFSFGAGGAAGIAGKTAAMGLAKRLLTREGIEIAAKEVGKKIVTKEGRQIALKAAGNSVKQGVKASLISTPLVLAAQITIDKFFNKDNVNKVFKEMLSKEQRRSMELAKRAKTEYKMAA